MEAAVAPTSYVGILWYSVYPVAYYDKPSFVEFEGRQLMAPADPDAVLTIAYGDYMALPPKEEQKCKHQLACYVDN